MMNVSFTTGNSAFCGGNGTYEVARLLRQIADRVEIGYQDGSVVDLNGNRVGEWSLSLPDTDEDEEDEDEN